MRETSLTDIPGVGPTRARRLLSRFGSLSGLASADPKSIEEAVGPATARAVLDYLEQGRARSRMKNVFEAEGDIREVDPLAALVTLLARADERRAAVRSGRVGERVRSGGRRDRRRRLLGPAVRHGGDPRARGQARRRRGRAPRARGGRRGAAALQTGLLTRREWKWGEKIRAIEVLSDLLAWNDGRYRFDAGAAPHAGDFRLRSRGCCSSSSSGRATEPHGSPARAAGPDARPGRAVRRRSSPRFGLTADAESVVRLIDGRSTAEEIAEKAPAEEFAVRKLLAALVTLGLVHPGAVGRRRAFPRRSRRRPPTSSPSRSSRRRSRSRGRTRAGTRRRASGAGAVVRTVGPRNEPARRRARDHRAGPAGTARGDGGASGFRSAALRPLRAAPAERPEWPEAPSALRGGIGEPSGILRRSRRRPNPRRPERACRPTPRDSRRSRGSLGLLVAAVAAVALWRARGPSPGTPAGGPDRRSAVTFSTATAAGRRIPRGAASTGGADRRRRRRRPFRPRRRPCRRERRKPPRAPSPRARPPRPSPRRPPRRRPDSREGWARRAESDRKRLASDNGARVTRSSSSSSARSSRSAKRGSTTAGRRCGSCRSRTAAGTASAVFWGRYPSLDAAKKGKTGIPPYFTTARNHPAVVSVR